MKITKQELIDLDACTNGLERFIKQTNNTEDEVEVASLIGGENTYSDLLWLAGKKLPEERIARFACDCALINIEKIKPYTTKYDMIVEFLTDPTAAARAAARAARAVTRSATRAAHAAHADAYYAARIAHVAAACAAGHCCTAGYPSYAAHFAADAAGNCEEVNKLLRELFS